MNIGLNKEKASSRNVDTQQPLKPNAEFLCEQANYLFQNSFASLIANLILGLLTLVVLWNESNTYHLLGWFLLLNLAIGFRLTNCLFFRAKKKSDISAVSAKRWIFFYGIGSTASSFLWGALVWVVQPHGNIEAVVYIIFAVGGIAAGAAAVQGPVATVLGLYIAASGLPLFIWLILEHTSFLSYVAFGVFFFYLMMMSIGLTYRKIILQSFLLSKALITAKNHAENSNDAKSRFLSNMSHEIRTPLNSIMGITHMMMDTQLDENQSDYVHRINLSSAHLLGIVNDILDFSKIEAKQLTLEYVNFDLEKLVNKVIQQLELSANAKNLELYHSIDEAVSTALIGDPLRLQQILINYVNNAIKFTQYGKVHIHISLVTKFEDNRVKLRFDVDDTGIGIEENQLEKLFQLFQQADESITRKYGGTGLGLVICKELARLMNGEVGVESSPGVGSRFWFTAELTSNTSQKPIEAERVITDLKGYSILLVEDNAVNQMVAKALLVKLHGSVDVAENGQKALERLSESKYDCVLMDIQMPVMDGYQATRAIRQQAQFKNLRIIALTANASSEDREKCLECGMNDMVTKPFKPNELLRAIVADPTR